MMVWCPVQVGTGHVLCGMAWLELKACAVVFRASKALGSKAIHELRF